MVEKMNQGAAGQAAAALAALGYYPSEAPARTMIADALMDICPTVEDSMWLVRRALQLHQEWSACGVKGLWQIWFSKHKPRNARECALELQVGSTPAYPDGVPPESPRLGAASPPLALTAGAVVSTDAESEQLITDLAEAKALPPMPKYRARGADEKRVDEILRRMYGEESAK